MNLFLFIFLSYSLVLTSGEDISMLRYPMRREVLKTFVDAFLPGNSGRPERGNPHATCWVRGGICVRVRHCPLMNLDSTVPGCNKNWRVCCRVQSVLSPTVGIARTQQIVYDFYLQDLDSPLMESIAFNNYKIFDNLIE